MDKNKNSYIFIYSVLLVIVVAGVLSIVAVLLQPLQTNNLDTEKKKNILLALNIEVETADVNEKFNSIVTSFFVDNLGNEVQESADTHVFYKAKIENETKYIFPLNGKGLWGPIWGYIVLNEDLNSIFGVYFGHKSETAGLGAEIASKHFQSQFIGKTIFSNDDAFTCLTINKQGAKTANEIDAVSGATITSNAVTDMIKQSLNNYLPFILKSRN